MKSMFGKLKEKLKNQNAVGGFDVEFFSITMILLAFGLVMLFSASVPTALYSSTYDNDKYAIFRSQLMWAGLGIVGMFFFAFIVDYKKLKRWVNFAFIVCLILMLLVPFIGVERNGATRWLGFGGFTIQPSELLKFALIAFLAKWLSDDKDGTKIQDFKTGFLPPIMAVGISCVLCVAQSHLSAMVIIAGIGLVILLVGGSRWSHLSIVGILGVIAVAALAVTSDYRWKRLTAFIDPEADPADTGYQILQSLYAIASGGVFGLGLGQSRQKHLYLPEATNDYIFAIVCEELGLLGAIILLALFALFVYRGMKIAFHAPDKFGMFLAFGVSALVALQVIINVGVDTSTFPSTGMQLPFFSSGGSALVFLLCAVGILLNISSHIPKEKKERSSFERYLRKKKGDDQE